MGFIYKLVTTLRSVANHPMNRQAKLKEAWRFCLINAATRVLPGDVCVPFPNNTRLLISPKMKGAAHFINPGLCEFDEMAFVMHFLRPKDVFVDVGANVGAYTVLASAVAGARTLAFEPNPSTFGYLSQNIVLNAVSAQARAINAALGAEPGALLLTDKLGTENYISRADENIPTVRVRVDTLDGALRDEPPALIKVDVEGFETQVFAGANVTLDQPSLQAMIVERSGIGARYDSDETALHGRIQSLGFIPSAYTAMERALRRIAGNAAGNIIYVRDFDHVQKRLRDASPFNFRGQQI